jgi:hypothetical protein
MAEGPVSDDSTGLEFHDLRPTLALEPKRRVLFVSTTPTIESVEDGKLLLNCTCFSRIAWGSPGGTERPDARPHEVTLHVRVCQRAFLHGSAVAQQACRTTRSHADGRTSLKATAKIDLHSDTAIDVP